MADPKAAREWVARARVLLGERRQASFGEGVAKLQDELKRLVQAGRDNGQLAPELASALEDMAGALSSAADPADGAGGPSTETTTGPDAPETVAATEAAEAAAARQLFQDFRVDYRQQRRALEPVLTPGEAGSLDLALDLADAQASLGRYPAAVTVLQKAAHRAAAIRSEGRVDAAAAEREARQQAELERERAAREAEGEKVRQGFLAIVDRHRALDPILADEKLACGVFSRYLMKLMASEQYADASTLLAEWNSAFDVWSKPGSPNQTRREGVRAGAERQQAARARIDASGIDAAVEAIERAKRKRRAELIETSRLISVWNGGQPHALEKRIGELVFEVDRRLQGLAGQAPDADDAPAHERLARRLVQAEDALAALQAGQEEADARLAEAKAAVATRIAGRQEALDAYVGERTTEIAERQTVVDAKQKALDLHAQQSQLQLKDAGGKAVNLPFSENVQKFYQQKLTELGLKEGAGNAKKSKLTDAERSLLALARAVVAAKGTHDALQKDATAATTRLDEATTTLADGRAPLDLALEAAKRQQAIDWATPAEITYSTPLGAAQLNAELPLGGSGRIEYRYDGRPIVAGTTLLPAGEARVLRAVVVEADTALFQATPPKEVAIRVRPGRITVSGAGALAHGHGTPFQRAALNLAVATDPSVPADHAGLLAALTVTVDGQPLANGQVLLAGEHTLTIRHPGDANHAPSAGIASTLTVHAAQQEIVWDGPVPTTYTFGTPLTAQQLNAAVRVTSDPPLADRLAELTKALRYTDEQGRPVTVGSVLAAGEARTVTARTPDRPNFAPAAPKNTVFRVERATRALAAAAGTPGPIGAVVQRADLQKLGKVYQLANGQGVIEFFVDDRPLAVGTTLTVGQKRKLRVALQADPNYQPAAEQTGEVEVLGFADQFTAAKNAGATTLGKKVHTAQKAAVDQLRQQIEALAAQTPDEDKFAKVDALLAEIETIEANLVTWQGAVPAVAPAGDAKLLDVQIVADAADTDDDKQRKKVAATVKEATQLVKHGGISAKDVAKLVPAGTGDTYSKSGNYPKGFKYQWTTPAGVLIEVYGHGPTVANNVAADSDSKKGNLVRVKIDGLYLKPNGTLTAQATDASSHMALY